MGSRAGTSKRGLPALYVEIYAVARRIPHGRVATYGQVAELAGIPGGARAVGTAMRALKLSDVGPVPWQRVVGKRSARAARISILDPVGGAIQRQILEAEGIAFSPSGAISLAEFGWLPDQ